MASSFLCLYRVFVGHTDLFEKIGELLAITRKNILETNSWKIKIINFEYLCCGSVGSEGLFNINSANGTILLAKTLPKELSGSYNLTIIACDTRHQCVESDVLISVQSVSTRNYLLLLIIILPLSFSLIFCLACVAAWKTQLLHQVRFKSLLKINLLEFSKLFQFEQQRFLIF